MNTLLCPNCDHELHANELYCAHCGRAQVATGKTVTLQPNWIEQSTQSLKQITERSTDRLKHIVMQAVLIIGVALVAYTIGLRTQPPTDTSQPAALMPAGSAIHTDDAPLPAANAIAETEQQLFILEYPTFTIYLRENLWAEVAPGISANETFSQETADFGELTFPYLTGNGLVLEGASSAQILADGHLLPDGNLLHFRDWKSGLTVRPAERFSIAALSFDYRTADEWTLIINEQLIPLPHGRASFIGIIFHGEYPTEFRFEGPTGAQRGLSLDSIALTKAE